MSITIALAGNPNSGKTTLFNALTGSNQFVGNWPGVTVEKKEGKWKRNKEVTITDLPGIYSLSPYTLEEVVSREYLIDQRPDVILNIIDGTNLERNLFLTTQLTEIGIPTVVAINMMDVVEKNGDKINTENLSKDLGCKVVKISALKGTGITEAAEEAVKAVKEKKTLPQHSFSGSVEHTLAHIEEAVLHDLEEEQQRWYAIKLFERDEKIIQKLKPGQEILNHIEKDIKNCEAELEDDSESIITSQRYQYIDSIIKHCCKIKNKGGQSVSDKIDRIVTNRFLALPIFAVVMFFIYYVSVTTVGAWVTDWTNEILFGDVIPKAVESFLVSIHCASWLQGLILEGIIAGVGAVIGFVPQMLVLFLFLAFLESCGYMARIAFILDRIFRRFGLSGKSFIPILIGTGCGVPGIMASRTIENERDRKMTIITTTFIPCGAKLPLIALISGALFDNAGWVASSAYFIGIASIICSGIILKKTRQFSGDVAPFVMELPSYHIPTINHVLRSTWERGWSFIKKAGTVVLLSCVFIWFVSHFGWKEGSFGMLSENNLEGSILAYIGSSLAWIFTPLGWGNWQGAVAAVMGLLAKENIVGTLGVLYGFSEVAEDGVEIWGSMTANFTAISGFSFLAFNLLCAPCFAAIGAIRREMNHRGWFWFAILYQCGFAYLIAFFIYQFGTLFTTGVFGIGTVVASVLLFVFFFFLFRRKKIKTSVGTLLKEGGTA